MSGQDREARSRGSLRRRRRPLATQVIALTTVVAAVTAVVFTGAGQLYLAEVERSKGIERMESNTALVEPYLAAAFDQMVLDLEVLVATPPILGLVRSTRNGGEDAADRSSTDQWKERLAMIFASVLEVRPTYTQLRYVGVADGGREIVRVDRREAGVERIPETELQRKSQEPYFETALALDPGEVGFSDVTPHREHGEVVRPVTATLRAMIPVHDESGEFFGFVVVNRDYEAMLGSLLGSLHLPRDVVVLDRSREVAYSYDAETGSSTLSGGIGDDRLLRGLVGAEGAGGTFTTATGATEAIVQYRDVRIEAGSASRELRVAIVAPGSEVFAGLRELRRFSLLLSLALVGLALLAGLRFGRRVAARLRTLSRAVADYGQLTSTGELPTDANDEIGDFARSFDKISKDLALARLSEKVYRNELRELVARLSDANERLEAANEDTRNLAYIISHDLRAPLINVLGFSSELERLLGTLRPRLEPLIDLDPEAVKIVDEKVSRCLDFVSSSAAGMESQLDSILELSRLGAYDFDPEPVDLAELCEELVRTHVVDEDATVTVERETLPVVEIDRKAIGIILANLVSNAAKYRQPGRALALRIGARTEAGGLVLEIEDNGRGIEADDRDSVFALFRRFGRQDVKGEGIGLAFCKTLVGRLDGQIWCESEPGEGSTFSVFLPSSRCPTRAEAA